MAKAPNFSLGFAFTANNSDLVAGLEQITAKAKGVSDEMEKMQKSMGSMPFDKRGFDKAQKAVAKAQEKIAESSVPEQPKIKARKTSSEDAETGFEGASTARLGAKFYEALEKSKLLADEFTGETAKNFEKVFVEIGKEAFESTKKIGASFDGVSRKTQRAFDNIFEALDKGTLKTLPNFEQIPKLLAGLPGLSVDARKAIVRLGLETKLTSQQVIDLLQSHESAIKKALQGSKKTTQVWEALGKGVGGALEELFPVNKELGKIYSVAEGLLGVLAALTDESKGSTFVRAWKAGADFFKKKFGKDVKEGTDAATESLAALDEKNKKFEKESDPAKAFASPTKVTFSEASIEDQYEQFKKLDEEARGKKLEGFEIEAGSSEDLKALEDSLKRKEQLEEAAAERMANVSSEKWKEGLEASADAAAEAAEKASEKANQAGKATGEGLAKGMEDAAKKADVGESLTEAVGEAAKEASAKAATDGASVSDKFIDAIKVAFKTGNISGSLSQWLDDEIRQGSSRMDELGKDTINRYVDGIRGAIGSADFATQLKEKIENDLKQSEEALQNLGRSAGEKFTSTIKDSLGKADFSSEVKGLADKVSISSIIPDTNALNEALNGFGANFNRLKDTVTMATDSITGDVGQGMRLLVTGAFRDMSESKDAFVKNLTDATTKISESMAKMKEAIVPEPQIERLNEIERGLDATEAKLKSLMEQEPPSSGQVPEELRGEMSQEVGDIKESISASSGEGMLEKLKGIIQSGQASADLGPAIAAMQRMPSDVASRVANAVGGAVSKIPSASTASNMSVNVPEVARGFGNIAKNVAGRIRGR